MDFSFFGHVSRDIFPKSESDGGASLFGSLLMSKLSQHTGVATSAFRDFDEKKYKSIEWNIQPSSNTTTFEIAYQKNQRSLRLRSKANEIDPNKIPKELFSSSVSMVCPILDEVTPNFFQHISSRWIGLAPQGWFRAFDSDGTMKQVKSKFQSLPKKIQLIVVSEDDVRHDKHAWEWIIRSGEVCVKTMGQKGYVLHYQGQEKHYEPMQVMKEKNPTGCGDIFSTSLLFLMSKGYSPEEAARNAGHAAGLAATMETMDDTIRIATDFLRTKIK